jgi:hypothetical protein
MSWMKPRTSCLWTRRGRSHRTACESERELCLWCQIQGHTPSPICQSC